MPRSSQQTRQRILDAAYVLFRRKGYTRVSMDEIAAATTVTKRTLYYHFTSKDELLAAVLEAQHLLALAAFRTFGDNLSGSPAFVAEGRLAKDLTDEAYIVAAYDFVLVESESQESGSTDTAWHDLDAFTFGAGFRLPVSPEVHFFFEPRGGVLFGSDADVAPVGMLSAGLEATAAEGITVRFAITGLATGTDISRNGTDARVESGIMGTFGIAFEF